METMGTRARGLYELTLIEVIKQLEVTLDDLVDTASAGRMWRQRRSDVSYSASQAVDKLSSSAKLLTAALSQLRYWLGVNGYATSLQVSKLLTSWSVGSVKLMDAIEAAFLGVFYTDLLVRMVPELAPYGQGDTTG